MSTHQLLPDFAEKIAAECVSRLPEEHREPALKALREQWYREPGFTVIYALPDRLIMQTSWIRREHTIGPLRNRDGQTIMEKQTQAFWLCSCEIIKHVARASGSES